MDANALPAANFLEESVYWEVILWFCCVFLEPSSITDRFGCVVCGHSNVFCSLSVLTLPVSKKKL